MVKKKRHISNHFIFRISLIVVLLCAAFAIDHYIDHHAVHIGKFQSTSKSHKAEQSSQFFLSASASQNSQTADSKNENRNPVRAAQMKELQSYHTQIFDRYPANGNKLPAGPIITSYHFLSFQKHIFPPGEDEDA